jgi:autotransporter-associated beta strand protein
VQLGANRLTVGSNDRNTSFGGVIDGTGSFTKSGRGSLTLNGASAYTGGTVIMGGTLLVANRSVSATGNGPVQVTKGILGGAGKIAGPVTVGNGTDATASLSAGLTGENPAALSLQSVLTFRSLAAYKVNLNSTTTAADEVIADGVTIGSDATAVIQDIGTGIIPVGTVFVIISNISASPIAGTFGNLGDNSSFTLNGNNFLVSYSGGTEMISR